MLRSDRVGHFMVGFVAYGLVRILTNSIILALLAVLLIALGKEIRDYTTKKGTPELMDFIATFLGGITFLLLEVIF